MSFIDRILDRITPYQSVQKSQKVYPAIGSTSLEDLRFKLYKWPRSTEKTRKESLKDSNDMRSDGAIADKALSKLCRDATSSEVVIEAPTRTSNAIKDMLERIEYQKHRESLMYLLLSDGDLFLQPEYVSSVNANKIGYITKFVIMPPETMLRLTNERDEFNDPQKAFAQVEDIQFGIDYQWQNPLYFPWAKIIHSRNDNLKSTDRKYGISIWYSGFNIFNLCMMAITDTAIMRHLAIQKLRVHRIGAESKNPITIDQEAINSYKNNFKKDFGENVTDIFIDGMNKIDEIGGIKSTLGNADDLMMILSILSVAVEYPIDLLSGMISRGSGGEELFRKEVVLKRTVDSLVKKEKEQILIPLIERELMLTGNYAKYKINSYPSTFEDQTKKSKRGLGEMQALVKSPRTFHGENNDEISWEQELEFIENDMKQFEDLFKKYPNACALLLGAAGRKDPQSGTQGNAKDPSSQQDRKTPGVKGNDDS